MGFDCWVGELCRMEEGMRGGKLLLACCSEGDVWVVVVVGIGGCMVLVVW